MTTDAEDRSTWPRNGQVIRRAELLRLIEENGGPKDLDLRGALFVGDAPGGEPERNPIDLSPEALAPLAKAYEQANGGRKAPWIGPRGGISLSEAQLQGANLGGAGLQRADFVFAQLQGAVLRRAKLEWAAAFCAQLEGADLFAAGLQSVLLNSARLRGASLDSANLEGAFLLNAELRGAKLRWAQLRQASPSHAQLQQADLSHADLREAALWEAQLDGAILHEADLQGAYLRRAQLQNVHLESAKIQRTDMYDVASLDGARWYGSLLDHTRIKGESLGKAIGDELEAHKGKTADAYHRAKEAYLLLKNNFNQIGRYEDASWAYVKEQQMEKMAHYWEWRSGVRSAWSSLWGWRPFSGGRNLRQAGSELGSLLSSFLRAFASGSLWRWFWNRAFEFLTGHGERPLKAVRAGVFVIVAFGGGFWATRAIANFWDALVYSIATFATFNLGRPGLNPEGRGVEIASSLEAILGIGVLALVVFTVGNRMSRG